MGKTNKNLDLYGLLVIRVRLATKYPYSVFRECHFGYLFNPIHMSLYWKEEIKDG